MNAGVLVFTVRDITNLLEQKGILLPDGTFDQTKLDTLKEDLDLAASVAAILKARGVDLPERVDTLLKLLPILASL